ncbi:MAG: hypothetical protein Kow0027_18740 [Saprospiraceae bacterium]
MAKKSGISGAMYFVVILVAFAILLFLRRSPETTPQHFNWWPDYSDASTQPYGNIVLKHFLQNTYGADSLLIFDDGLDGLPKAGKDHGAYLFIGRTVFEEEQFLDSLLSFVEAGNEALILTESFSYEFLDQLLLQECDWLDVYYEYLDRFEDEQFPDTLYQNHTDELAPNDNIWEDYILTETEVNLSLAGPGDQAARHYTLQKLFKNEPSAYSFEFIRKELLCDSAGNFQVLGYLNDSLINFVRFDLGNGRLYLHTTPLAFTNHPILHGETLPYVSGVFSRLSSGKIYWDQSSHYEFPGSPSRVAWREGPLHYVLSQPPLAIAWYILLALAILFLLFRAKRRQRVIPVLEANTNTSLEFIENIGRLYFMSEDYRHLLLLKMQMFLSYVRNQYRIPTNKLDEHFAKTLALRSGVDDGIIDKILLIFKNVDNSDFVSQSTLVRFHQFMDKFYQESRR